MKIKTPNGRVKLRTEGELRGQANLRNANLGRDNIGGSAQLNAADLREAVLVGARLEGAEYDARTHFPAGFRPEEDGRGLTGAAGQQA